MTFRNHRLSKQGEKGMGLKNIHTPKTCTGKCSVTRNFFQSLRSPRHRTAPERSGICAVVFRRQHIVNWPGPMSIGLNLPGHRQSFTTSSQICPAERGAWTRFPIKRIAFRDGPDCVNSGAMAIGRASMFVRGSHCNRSTPAMRQSAAW